MIPILHQDIRPLIKIKVHEIELNTLVDSFKQLSFDLGINFLSYSVMTNNSMTVYRTGKAKSYLAYLNDRDCYIPIIEHNGPAILQWDDYCSDRYLIRRQIKLNQRALGACIVLQHHHHHEILSLGSSQHCLFDTLINHRELKHRLMNAIRTFIQVSSKSISYFCTAPQLQRVVSQNKFLVFPGTHANLPSGQTYFLVGNKGPVKLTLTEVNCLDGVLALQSAKEIAVFLNLSHKTIEASIAKLKKKLGVKKRNDIFTIALNNNLI